MGTCNILVTIVNNLSSCVGVNVAMVDKKSPGLQEGESGEPGKYGVATYVAPLSIVLSNLRTSSGRWGCHTDRRHPQ